MTIDVVVKTWWGDLSFCSYALRFLERNWLAESNIIVLADSECEKVCSTWGFSSRVKYFYVDPWPDGNQFQGYLTLLCDDFSAAEYFAILDSDCMLIDPLDTACLFEGDKPILYYRPYGDALDKAHPAAQRLWAPIMEKWLGVTPQADYMQRFPFVYRASTLQAVRRLITSRTGRGVRESLYSGVPYKGPEGFLTHPFKFVEHNVISFYAHIHEPKLYSIRDLTLQQKVTWPVKQYWSWGWNEHIRDELDQLLARNYVPNHLPRRTTPSGWMVLADDVRDGHSSLTIQADRIDVDVGGLPTHAFLAPYLEAGMKVIDIGAHIGNFSVPMMRAVGPEGWVVAFEPHPGIIPCLRHNVDKERRDNPLAARCTVLGFALGAVIGETKLHCNPGNYASNTLLDNVFDCSLPATTVKVEKLDSLINADDHISFIKMDVEGGELNVLRGAEGLLKRCHPVIFMEFSENFLPLAGITEDEFYQYLRSLGYSQFVPFPKEWAHPHDLLVLP